MNMNMIINMVIRRVMSIVINKGINAGVDKMASRKKGGAPATPEDKAAAQQTAQRMRQGARLTRRMGRF